MDGIITDEEKKRLEDNYNYRKLIVEQAFKNGAPESAKDIEAVNGVLNSMDKAVYDNVTSRLKHQDNQNKGAIIATVVETLKAISAENQRNVNPNRISTLDSIEYQIDTVEGETDISDRKFTLDEIMKQGE